MNNPTKADRAEGGAQIAIMLVIGLAGAAASFTHVHDVAAAHGQAGPGGWLAWADAVVLELMSIASGLEMRRRKRAGHSTKGPFLVLLAAVGLSLSAQILEAEPTVIGWVAASVPALGFLAMAKMALGRSNHTPTAAAPAQPVSVPVAVPMTPVLPVAAAPVVNPVPVILRRPPVAVPATAKFLPIVSALTAVMPAITATARPLPIPVSPAPAGMRLAPASARTTVTEALPINPRTGQPYSERHSRRLATGK